MLTHLCVFVFTSLFATDFDPAAPHCYDAKPIVVAYLKRRCAQVNASLDSGYLCEVRSEDKTLYFEFTRTWHHSISR